MANRIIQVSFNWTNVPEVARLDAAIRPLCDDWCRLNLFTYYLWTRHNPTEVYAGLSRIVTEADTAVLTAIDPLIQPYGWAPSFVWEWLYPKVYSLRSQPLLTLNVPHDRNP